MKAFLLTCALLCGGLLLGQLSLDFSPLDSTFVKPLGLISRGDGSDHLYILGKDGPIHRYNTSTKEKVLFLDFSDIIETQGEAGLLGATFHPEADSNYFYLLHTIPGPDHLHRATICLSRFTINDEGMADQNSEYVMLYIDKPHYNQSGGGIAFGPDGYLYLGTGDGGGQFDPHENAQNPKSLLGKILRIDVDKRGTNGQPYAIPPSNPFVHTSDTLDEVWSLGLRNPFRFAFDEHTGDLWISDKANSFWQEVNFQPAGSPGGQNYGWNCEEGFEKSFPSSKRFCGDQTKSYDGPRISYGRSGDTDFVGGSITGGRVYHGPEADLQGLYIFGDFYGHRLFVFDPARNSEDSIAIIKDTPIDNLTTLGRANDGSLYAVDYSGKVYLVTVQRPSSLLRAPRVVDLSVYPNPATSTVTARWSHSNTVSLKAWLTDGSGRRVTSWDGLNPTVDGEVFIRFASLPAGLYSLTLSDDHRLASARLVLK